MATCCTRPPAPNIVGHRRQRMVLVSMPTPVGDCIGPVVVEPSDGGASTAAADPLSTPAIVPIYNADLSVRLGYRLILLTRSRRPCPQSLRVPAVIDNLTVPQSTCVRIQEITGRLPSPPGCAVHGSSPSEPVSAIFPSTPSDEAVAERVVRPARLPRIVPLRAVADHMDDE
jgi:hypothetical protein